MHLGTVTQAEKEAEFPCDWMPFKKLQEGPETIHLSLWIGAVPTVWLMSGEDVRPRVRAGVREVDRGYCKPRPTSPRELLRGLPSLMATQFPHLQNEILESGPHGCSEDKIR